MRTFTAKQAKNNFGSLLDAVQREPILITKTQKPAGLFISLEDLKGTPLVDLFEEKAKGYDEWVQQQVSSALESHQQNPDSGIEQQQIMASVMQKARQKLGLIV
ncbi:type II toxin-antitoxin system Phd/YefM family antitoxin [Testudinibacter sp. TR-2022]|uniref:type II toxin-antitoxin system Phd/YefM family antitoxin n=1 Tax=Testudinibacter sp. TR-2022 TaxID=2585029 RepID=UPI00111AD954|nr:type II toxin-antitoxin system Phd/YefM family antitoxin [Testudinibacter sp. TR-2022]TNH08317.1 type II toxin-antitoxin system Phd/YefM family antitoxin [Pasteurellaceae bacterium Phil11]TNH25405.1 type II toxin-antitoxin system Phd/YefM family antitoxin [Testudinibacter sp. TR-2022]TNH27520.1 type II toxin-antitoxin system Phd/YefM family antitoxin [Testudinibacter sp. TR-2022]